MIYLTTHDTNVVHRLNKFGYRPQHISRISQHAMEVSDILIVQEQKQDRSCKYVLCADQTMRLIWLCIYHKIFPDGICFLNSAQPVC